MSIGEKPIRSFDDLLRATNCADASDLEERVNGRMDGNGFAEAHWDEDGVEIVVGFGTRGISAEFTFPFRLSDFWTLVNETADEVEELEQ